MTDHKSNLLNIYSEALTRAQKRVEYAKQSHEASKKAYELAKLETEAAEVRVEQAAVEKTAAAAELKIAEAKYREAAIESLPQPLPSTEPNYIISLGSPFGGMERGAPVNCGPYIA